MSKTNVWVGIAVAVVLALIGFVLPLTAPAPSEDDNTGGQRSGLQEFSDGIKLGLTNVHWYEYTFEPQEDQKVVFRNTTGKAVVADFGELLVSSGTASSSIAFSLIATTTSEIPNSHDFTALTATSTGLITEYTLATSTSATTTSSILAAVQSKGNGSVIVPVDWYVIAYLRTASAVGCSNTGACETATSSKRGINPTFRIRIHY